MDPDDATDSSENEDANSRLSSDDFERVCQDQGYRKTIALVQAENPIRSRAAEHKKRQRERLAESGVRQFNVNVSDDPRVRDLVRRAIGAIDDETSDLGRALIEVLEDKAVCELVSQIAASPQFFADIESALDNGAYAERGRRTLNPDVCDAVDAILANVDLRRLVEALAHPDRARLVGFIATLIADRALCEGAAALTLNRALLELIRGLRERPALVDKLRQTVASNDSELVCAAGSADAPTRQMLRQLLKTPDLAKLLAVAFDRKVDLVPPLRTTLRSPKAPAIGQKIQALNGFRRFVVNLVAGPL